MPLTELNMPFFVMFIIIGDVKHHMTKHENRSHYI